MRFRSLSTLALVPCLFPVGGCTPGAGGQAVRAEPPTANEALGEAECRDVNAGGRPLVVDWSDDERADLEIALRKKIVVVEYSCNKLRILEGCTVDEGDYGFVGITRKENVVNLANADEIAASLPTHGGTFIAKLGGELQRDTSLDLALITVGKQSTTRRKLARSELKGDCDGATHFLRRASVGAFALRTGSRGSVATVAEIFGVGASAKSASSKQVSNRDGSLDECKKSSTDANKPPEGCGAVLRLDLVPIAKYLEGDDSPVGPPTKPGGQEEEDIKCPKGLVVAEGKCVRSDADAPRVCNRSDRDDCKSQCEKGSLRSCEYYGTKLRFGDKKAGVPVDVDAALDVHRKACEAGDMRNCFAHGSTLRFEKKAPREKWYAEYEKACLGGNNNGCYELAAYHRKQPSKDEHRRAVEYWRRGCDGGDSRGCEYVALSYLNADAAKRALQPDEQIASRYLIKACVGGALNSCVQAGRLFEGRPWCEIGAISANVAGKHPDPRCREVDASLRNLSKDRDRAVGLYQRACSRLSTGGYGAKHGCDELNRLGVAHTDMPDDAPKALERYTKSCNFTPTPERRSMGGGAVAVRTPSKSEKYDKLLYCIKAGQIHENGYAGVKKDPGKAVELYRKACSALGDLQKMQKKSCNSKAYVDCSMVVPRTNAARQGCAELKRLGKKP